MTEPVPSTMDLPPVITPIPGEAFRVSDCCLAGTNNIVERTHPELDEWSSTFTCKQCGKPCLSETNQRYVEAQRTHTAELDELRAEIARLKGKQ